MTSTEVELRHVTEEKDYDQCLELQRLTWGDSFNELVPAAIQKISQKVGGVVAGAFEPSGRMLAFVFGMTGVREGRLAHWSHMLAVRPEARGLGLGKRLKLFQRQELLPLGVEVMFWSYDPLVARNANLNLNRLGAVPREYVRDMYGADTGSDVHSGLGTDRFVVAWELAAPEVEARLRRAESGAPGEHERPVEPVAADRVLNVAKAEGEPMPVGSAEVADPGDAERVWIEIPVDIERVRQESRCLASRWREGSRAALEEVLDRGYGIVGLVFDDGRKRCFYVARKGQDESSKGEEQT